MVCTRITYNGGDSLVQSAASSSRLAIANPGYGLLLLPLVHPGRTFPQKSERPSSITSNLLSHVVFYGLF